MTTTHRLVQQYYADAIPIASDVSFVNTGDFDVDESITGSVTDEVISIAIDVSQVKSIIILSDQALTLKTNSHSAPSDTLTLVAGYPYIWNSNSYNTLKLGTDVTSIHVDNPASAAARLQISGVYDATP